MTELGEDLPASSGAVMGLRSASIPIDLRARGEPRAGDARPRGGEVPGSLAELLIGGKVRGEPRRGEPERDGEVDRRKARQAAAWHGRFREINDERRIWHGPVGANVAVHAHLRRACHTRWTATERMSSMSDLAKTC